MVLTKLPHEVLASMPEVSTQDPEMELQMNPSSPVGLPLSVSDSVSGGVECLSLFLPSSSYYLLLARSLALHSFFIFLTFSLPLSLSFSFANFIVRRQFPPSMFAVPALSLLLLPDHRRKTDKYLQYRALP